MRTVAKLLSMLLSLLLVFAPLSASACDLSCRLQPNGPDCHRPHSAGENSHGTMSDAADMDMSYGAETGATQAQTSAAADHTLNANTHHLMPTQMDMRRGSLQIIRKSDASSSARFDNSNTLSPCVHGICAQAVASASPPTAGHAQPVHLQFVASGALNPAKSLMTTRPAPERAPPLSLLADLLPILRI